MSKRSRIIGYGLASGCIVAGILGAVLVNGEAGQLLALVLISIGFVLATSLVFLEVGLSEDREFEREREQQRRRARTGQRTQRRPRLERMRGERRRFK